MGQALYRKYRSKGWGELIGQEHVTKTLENAIKSGKFGHAYLFSGPHGVGKTSAARILARQINNLEYLSDEPHIDIIEIDAASNTSVEDIRDLREKVNVAPTLARYKIYIIDEVHMLSKSAVNALLKTLEEPPSHVVFVLATTDPQKLPETIISRTQHFTFRPISGEIAARQIMDIAKAEQIQLDKNAASLISELGQGSFRDSLSLLDQAAGSGAKITEDMVLELAGSPPAKLIMDIIRAIDERRPRDVVQLLENASLNGYQAASIASQLGRDLRMKALETSEDIMLALAKQLLAVTTSRHPEQLLEIILLEFALHGSSPAKPTKPPDTIAHKDSQIKPTEPKLAAKIKSAANSGQLAPETISTTKKIKSDAVWSEVLERIRSKHHTLYGMARMATSTFSDNEISLEFPYTLHLKKVNDADNKKILEAVAGEVAGRSISVVCKLSSSTTDTSLASKSTKTKKTSLPSTDPSGAKANPDELKNISNIFGGAELLQSD